MERIFLCDETTTADTACGKVQGYYYHGVYTFKGIPYASAKRFHKPHPVKPWDGIRDATSFGYVCPLLRQEKPDGELKVPHRYWLMDEDCLNLNVWTPGIDREKRPVLVWLHGGAFEGGSSIEQAAYDADTISSIGNVVTVSINHRLNILGYLDLSPYGEKYRGSANAGTSDLIAALKWVQDNIEKFGGDPGNVTLFGQSGGGEKLTTLLQSPEADGLYHKGVIMSGVIKPGMLGADNGDSRPLIRALLTELGISESQTEELERIPYGALAAAYEKTAPRLRMEGNYTGCCPKIEDDYKGSPLKAGFRQESRNIPLIVGTVFGEFAFWKLPYDKKSMTREQGIELLKESIGEASVKKVLPLFEQAFPHRNPIDLTCYDVIFRGPSAEYIRKRAKDGSRVYAYLFDMDFPLESGKPAWHCSDIPFVFHNTHLTPYANIPGVTERLEQQMSGSLLSFARTGNPNHPKIPSWNESTADTEYIMVFGENTVQRTNLDVELQKEMIAVSQAQFAKMMGRMEIKH